MTVRKFFTLEPEEEFLGVIRPSLWVFVPSILSSFVFIVFPFIFWSSLLNLGLVFGACLSILSFFIGIVEVRDIRRKYIENGVFVTSLRAIDVRAARKSFQVTELSWKEVEKISSSRRGISSLFGYGHIIIRGADADGFSLRIGPVWKPDLVVAALPKVQ